MQTENAQFQNQDTLESYKTKFQQYRANHPIMIRSSEEVINQILNTPYPIITVFGPAGVGKTKGLIPEVEKRLSSIAQHRDLNVKGLMPAITVRAPAQSRRTFDWRDFYRRILEAGGHPLIQRIADKSESGYKQTVRLMLTHRKTMALIVDEAQHLTNVTPWAVAQQLDCMKDLVEGLDVHVVLVGNYQLLDYPFAGDQIGRRNNTPIHFSRYRLNRTFTEGEHGRKDQEAYDFMSIVYSLAKNLPIADGEELHMQWEYFYTLSLGCTGILKDWLEHALRQAISDNQLPLSLEYIKKFAPIPQKIKTLLDTISMYEDEAESILRAWDDDGKSAGFESNKETANEAPPKRQTRRPGMRKPKRDPTGAAFEEYA